MEWLALFVAISNTGTGNRSMSSPDGINWTLLTTATDNDWAALAWAAELNVLAAVSTSGTGNRVMSSNVISYSVTPTSSNQLNASVNNTLNKLRTPVTDSTNCVATWISRSNPSDDAWSCVEYSPELTLFVAVSGTGTIMTSGDSITWTMKTAPNSNSWTSVVWSSELILFVAVANSGTGNRVMTSVNGTAWVSRTSAADNNWASVCWSPELTLFVAVANSGTGNRVMTSPDGVTWTSRTTPADNSWNSVIWCSDLSLFVAVSSTGTGNRVMTSPDGITWTLRTTPANNSWDSLTWSGDYQIFVAVASSGTGNRIMTSSDGITWTIRSSPVDNDWQSVVWSSNIALFVAVSNTGSGNRVMTSYNGIYWTTRPTNNNNWTSITWSKQLSVFVAVSNSGVGNRIMTSSIGIPDTKSVLLVNPSQMSVNKYTGNVTISGSLSKGAGTFMIDHPLVPEKKLIHSFIEGPRCDNIYRGTTRLINGIATVNLDKECTETIDSSMTEGTFNSLNKNYSWYLQNIDSFDRVLGKIEGNCLIIICENNQSSDSVNWMVIGERRDDFIKRWEYTNSSGNLVTEW
jgi:hypothetical protein